VRGAAEVYREGHVTQWLPVAENRIAEAELAKTKRGQTTKRH